jgi:hypothetical protein
LGNLAVLKRRLSVDGYSQLGVSRTSKQVSTLSNASARCVKVPTFPDAARHLASEGDRKFGDVVRSAGGAIFAPEMGPSVGSRQEEKLQIGTPDGFVKLAVLLHQPDIDAVLRERTMILIKHAEELRTASRPAVATENLIPPDTNA